jgi:hypothetical protein
MNSTQKAELTLPAGRNFRLPLHILTGGLIALAAVVSDFAKKVPAWTPAQTAVLAAGLAIAALGLLPDIRFITRLSANICLSILSLFVFLVVSEAFFRLIRFDFAREEQAFRDMPIYGTQPTLPVGEVYFHRPGPATWTGRILSRNVQLAHVPWDPYASEPAVTAKYNKAGFRNPDELSDWDVAVTGDSFTELGYLPDDELFTTKLGKLLNRRVLNLGTSYTGPLTQLTYLKQFGVSPATRDTVVVFFEGNDLTDLDREYEDLLHWKETGRRPLRNFKKQTSFARALYDTGKQLSERFAKKHVIFNAYFASPGADIPVMLTYAPPAKSEVSKQSLERLDYFFSEYARFGAERKVTVWLTYMPGKERVLHDYLTFTDDADRKLRTWQPNDLPALISEFCDKYGIKFIDLTPAFMAETKKNMHLLYNPILDSHINARGSELVARELARHLDGNAHAN